MRKQTKNIIWISLIVMILLVIFVIYNNHQKTLTIGISSEFNTSDDTNLIYRPFPIKQDSPCGLQCFSKSTGGSYNYYSPSGIESLYFSNGKIFYNISITGTCSGNAITGANNPSQISCSILDMGERTTTNLYITNRVLYDCFNFGAIDPIPYNQVNETKCNAYCIPNAKTCVKRSVDNLYESQQCTSDGSQIIHKICGQGCSDGVCIGGEYDANPVVIEFPVAVKDGFYGMDYTQKIKIIFDGTPYQGAIVNGEISDAQGKVIAITTGYTDSTGLADIVFNKVTALGYLNLKISTNIRGISRTSETIVYFNDMPPIIMNVEPLRTNYRYNEDIGANIYLKAGNIPFSNADVSIKIINSLGAIVQETTVQSNSQGIALANFKAVKCIGYCKITATTTIIGRVYSAQSSDILFEGNPFITTASARTLVQYNTAPLVFVINIQDTYGKFISLDMITNKKIVGTLTQGTVIMAGLAIKYLGSGDYEITIPTSGYGTFTGRMLFDFNGKTFQTEPINIEIEPDTVAIDISKITVEGTRYQNKTIILTFASASGQLIDPDSIIVEVTYPSGTAKDIITKASMTKNSLGVWQFVYNNFVEVEKYTFDIYADKKDYIRGNAKASVSVGGESGTGGGMAGTPVIGYFIQYSSYIVIAIIIIIALIIWLKRRRR